MKRPSALLPATLVALAACGDAPTGVPSESYQAVVSNEIVITSGVPAPRRLPSAAAPLFAVSTREVADLAGSVASTVSMKPASCGGAATYGVVVSYTITGRQAGAASFQVPTQWTYGASGWTGASPITVTVPAREAYDAPTIRRVPITLANAAGVAPPSTTVAFAPSEWVGPSGATLAAGAGTTAVDVGIVGCAAGDAPPSIVVPADFTVEATSVAGATVSYAVTASDSEDGILTSDVMCNVPSGRTLPLGVTTVRCVVTDAGGRSATGHFDVTVVDSSPAFFTSFPSRTVSLVAATIDGAALDLASLGIAAADERNVSAATFACDEVDRARLPIGSTTPLSCRPKDAHGNVGASAAVDVVVGLGTSGSGFVAPLTMAAPYSTHRRGTTIPHRFRAPTYADGTPATDLAAGLRFVVQRIAGPPAAGGGDVRPAAGSAQWRYDAASGEYVFDLATPASWDPGTWRTSVSYAGIPIASTQFELRR